MRRFLMAAIAMVMAALAGGGVSAQDSARLALLIANEDYPTDPGRLRRPHADAAALETALERAGFSVRVVRDADETGIARAVERFSQDLSEAGSAAVGFFYFAGHGAVAIADGGRRNFMLPARTEVASAAAVALNGVRLDRTIDALQNAGAASLFIVYDACRNEFSRGARGFQPMPSRAGMLVAMSTMADAVTPDDGAYAVALAEEIGREGQTAEDVFINASRTVNRERPTDQYAVVVPALREEFCFLDCEEGEDPRVAARAALEAALADTVEAWDAFLAAHGESEYAAEARRLRAAAFARENPEEPPTPSAAELARMQAQNQEAQRLLAAMGYYEGPVDGVFHAAFGPAISAFQSARGLAFSQTVDESLLAELRAASVEGHRSSTANDELRDITVGSPGGDALEAVHNGADVTQATPAGTVFRDALSVTGYGPEMVVIPAGSFVMGSPGDEAGRDSAEGPQHEVTIGEPFAVGRFEVTREEWRVCHAQGGCGHRGGGREGGPVVSVDWNDAQDYVAWLSEETGQTYRLLSEAEWEYAARAGTTTRYAFGDSISGNQARFGNPFQGTIRVGSFAPNAFGLYDMHGNVWEWVQDCWNGSYAGAPSDGRAWESGDCSRRVFRGGSWYDSPRYLRSAIRLRSTTGNGYRGFRVARTISP